MLSRFQLQPYISFIINLESTWFRDALRWRRCLRGDVHEPSSVISTVNHPRIFPSSDEAENFKRVNDALCFQGVYRRNSVYRQRGRKRSLVEGRFRGCHTGSNRSFLSYFPFHRCEPLLRPANSYSATPRSSIAIHLVKIVFPDSAPT